jgi:hypothetical protein
MNTKFNVDDSAFPKNGYLSLKNLFSPKEFPQ